MSNMIECGTCGYPLTPEERTTLIEHNGRMILSKECVERGCMAYDDRVDEPGEMIRTEWQWLTDDEIALICGECAASAHKTDDISYARAIEAKLREKNTVRMRRATRDEKISNPGVYWVEDKE
ncbi:hypothetical protein UFOVP729_16 [uncultured Caudovirales phage]|uniref:Uncharacterized protein n=1 Tax=uncultured Caudovirales phage TaxID=2100421 RepID=A0A6J5NU42_9CAUD|nr:hypothetical protein UFOVP729_16 [uncultured Caudovirales phage]